MLFCRSQGQTRVEPAELARRIGQLAARQWLALLAAAAAQTTLQGQQDRQDHGAERREKQQQDETQRRAERAMALAHLREMSAAASLQAAPLAPANQATLEALRDPSKRPRECRVPLPARLADFRPQWWATCAQHRQVVRPLAWRASRRCGGPIRSHRRTPPRPSRCSGRHRSLPACNFLSSAGSDPLGRGSWIAHRPHGCPHRAVWEACAP